MFLNHLPQAVKKGVAANLIGLAHGVKEFRVQILIQRVVHGHHENYDKLFLLDNGTNIKPQTGGDPKKISERTASPQHLMPLS